MGGHVRWCQRRGGGAWGGMRGGARRGVEGVLGALWIGWVCAEGQACEVVPEEGGGGHDSQVSGGGEGGPGQGGWQCPRVRVCVCVCTCATVHACVYVCVHVRGWVGAWVGVYACVCVLAPVLRVRVCMCVPPTQPRPWRTHTLLPSPPCPAPQEEVRRRRRLELEARKQLEDLGVYAPPADEVLPPAGDRYYYNEDTGMVNTTGRCVCVWGGGEMWRGGC